jgi:hypothetical protein
MGRDTLNWFAKVPGLTSERQLLAWKHRTEAPYIHAQTVQRDTDGSGIRVDMIQYRAGYGIRTPVSATRTTAAFVRGYS